MCWILIYQRNRPQCGFSTYDKCTFFPQRSLRGDPALQLSFFWQLLFIQSSQGCRVWREQSCKGKCCCSLSSFSSHQSPTTFTLKSEVALPGLVMRRRLFLSQHSIHSRQKRCNTARTDQAEHPTLWVHVFISALPWLPCGSTVSTNCTCWKEAQVLWFQMVANWNTRELSSTKGMGGHYSPYSHRISLQCNMPKFILVKDAFFFFSSWTLAFCILAKIISHSALNVNFGDLIRFSQKICSESGNQTYNLPPPTSSCSCWFFSPIILRYQPAV